jgi:hypothetical protein
MSIAGLAIAGACHSYMPVVADVNVKEEVRVEFAAPRDVEGTLPSGEVLTLHSVKEIDGLVLSVSGDSVVIAGRTAIAQGNVQVPIAAGMNFTAVRSPAVSISAKRFDENKTALVGVTGGLVVLYVAVLALTLSILAVAY